MGGEEPRPDRGLNPTPCLQTLDRFLRPANGSCDAAKETDKLKNRQAPEPAARRPARPDQLTQPAPWPVRCDPGDATGGTSRFPGPPSPQFSPSIPGNLDAPFRRGKGGMRQGMDWRNVPNITLETHRVRPSGRGVGEFYPNLPGLPGYPGGPT